MKTDDHSGVFRRVTITPDIQKRIETVRGHIKGVREEFDWVTWKLENSESAGSIPEDFVRDLSNQYAVTCTRMAKAYLALQTTLKMAMREEGYEHMGADYRAGEKR